MSINDTETCMLELNPDQAQSSSPLADHMKVAFGPSWKESLCEKELDGKIDPGHPSLLVISLSALRSLDLLRLAAFVRVGSYSF